MRVLGSIAGSFVMASALAGFGAADAAAQLISPGRLSLAHADLEGVGSCTQCHELRQRGISEPRCLSCHAPLSVRIERGRGLHGSFEEKDCAACHKEHLGASADLVRFDASGFSHGDAGYDLEGAHAAADCRSCHAPSLIQDREVRRIKSASGALEKTWLGLGRSCESCHASAARNQDPHQGQFDSASCERCHTETAWSETQSFDHARARYPLTGRHLRLDCAACHEPARTEAGASFIRYKPLQFSGCLSCHADPHAPTLGSDCATCHQTGGWANVESPRFERRFDHANTGFPLFGAHALASCAACHDASTNANLNIEFARSTANSNYPPPVLEQGCMSCHVDRHEGAFAAAVGGPDCASCHDDSTWIPSSFDLFRHAATNFPLEGAHRATPCAACHYETTVGVTEASMMFGAAATSCLACHLPDDPHRGQFDGRTCDSCHGQARFAEVDVDHNTTGFPLLGAHQEVACSSCHMAEVSRSGSTFVRYAPLSTECRACHTAIHTGP